MKSNISRMRSLRVACLCALSVSLFAVFAPSVHAEQFWTAQALLADQFKTSKQVSYVRAKLDPSARARIDAKLRPALPKSEYTLFVAKTGDRIDGYALFDEQLGQHEPISFATFFDAAGQVTRVEVVAYREPYGEGIRAERFRRQFVGRTAQSKYRPGADIDTISGATISSRAACIAVERAAAIVDAYLHNQATSTIATR